MFKLLLLSLLPLTLALSEHEVELAKRLPANCTSIKATGGKNAPGLKNPANSVCTVPTRSIDDKTFGLQVGTINNWGGGLIPPGLRGIFYMEGNPNSGSECFSTGAAVFNLTTYSTDLQQWAPKTWSVDAGQHLLADNLRDGISIQNKCSYNSGGYLRCDTNFWLRKGNKIQHKGDYTASQYSKDQWLRNSNVPGAPLIPGSPQSFFRYQYNMYRIVDENGQRTQHYEQRYVANIGRTIGTTGQANVHLKEYQEVPIKR